MSMNSTNYAYDHTYNSPPVTVILTVILLVFFFVSFFSIYFGRCFVDNIMHAWQVNRTPSGNLVRSASSQENRGLDLKIVESYPSFPYSSIKEFRCEKYAMECAICLSEFNDDDMLRLITDCYHVFHQECIDLWFGSHKTCPVCRKELDAALNTSEKSPAIVHNNSSSSPIRDIRRSLEDHMINNRDGDDDEEVNNKRNGKFGAASEPRAKRNVEPEERFLRSHSTGHSLYIQVDQENKYQLRLMENVKIKITRRHNATESCVMFGDVTSCCSEPKDCRNVDNENLGSSRADANDV